MRKNGRFCTPAKVHNKYSKWFVWQSSMETTTANIQAFVQCELFARNPKNERNKLISKMINTKHVVRSYDFMFVFLKDRHDNTHTHTQRDTFIVKFQLLEQLFLIVPLELVSGVPRARVRVCVSYRNVQSLYEYFISKWCACALTHEILQLLISAVRAHWALTHSVSLASIHCALHPLMAHFVHGIVDAYSHRCVVE